MQQASYASRLVYAFVILQACPAPDSSVVR
jgi:hypothetical protein